MMRRGVAVVLIFVATVLSGACSMAPTYQTPEIPVPDRYDVKQGSGLDLDGNASVRLSWKQYFTDPELQRLIDQALQNNRDLVVMILRVQEAQALYGIERSSLFPGLTASAAAARVGLPSELSPTRSAQSISQYSVAAIASWEIDFWGRIRNLNEVALRNYLVSESTQLAARISLIGQVAQVYYSLVATIEQMDIASAAVLARQRTFEMFRRRFQVGSGTRLEVAQSETLLTQAQAMVAELAQQKRRLLNHLALLTGDYGLLDGLSGSKNVNLSLPALDAGLPSELLLHRPDIVAAEERLKAANANIGAARAAFFPSITLNGAVAGISPQLSSLFDSASRAWLFAPSLSLPIFDGQRLQSNLDLAVVRKNITIAQYENAIQQAFREVSDALSDRQALQERLEIQRRTVAAESERARLVKLRYETGSSSYFEVLDSLRDLLRVQQQLVQQEQALVLANVRLYTALGSDHVLNAQLGQDSEKVDADE